MAYAPRVEEPGLVVHVTANAVDGHPLYRDDDDRIRRYDLLADQAAASEWTILGWCFMTTHDHFLVKLRKPTLSSGFQRLQSRYARAYNRRHKRRGVVWQRRFHTEIVESERHLRETIRYIARNPVRARMVDAAEEWEWSSYAAAIGSSWPDPIVDERELLGLFASKTAVARKRLQAFVEEKDPRVRWSLRPL